MRRISAILGLIAVLLLGAQLVRAAGEPPELAQFRANRAAWALDLSRPIATCVAMRDTGNPAFHGCIDWHSAVHGTWALTAYGWATGDDRYRGVVDKLLRPEAIAQERAHLERDPDFEMPYGRAWFLRLAIDYRRAFGDDRLDAIAATDAASLIARYRATAPDPGAIAYDSDTWALMNLYDYGAARGDAAIAGFVADQVRRYYLAAGPCPVAAKETATGEFMALCTNWAALVGRVLPPDRYRVWLDGFFPEGTLPMPVVEVGSVHQEGLNFSRTWGLWEMYARTGERRFLAAYLHHFSASYGHPASWNGGYRTVAHWVAQFGMLGLVETYYPWPPKTP